MPKSRKRKLNRDSTDVTESVDVTPIDKRAAVRPGTFNLNGEFFNPEGVLVRRTKTKVSPSEAARLVLRGARVAFEGCGCGGGGGGCTPSWPDRSNAANVAAAGKPQFTGKYGSPTWIDVWSGGEDTVVFLHGDVRWGTLVGLAEIDRWATRPASAAFRAAQPRSRPGKDAPARNAS